MEPTAVFHFTLAEIMQIRLPVIVLLQILGRVFRNQDVTGVATIHHALRDVDAGTGNVRPLVYVDNLAHRSTVNSHSQLNVRMAL